MTGYGPPEDPSREPTRRADLSAGGHLPPEPPPEPAGPSDPPTGSYAHLKPDESEPPAPLPWYRRRAVLIAWGLFVLALLALVLYGLVHLAGRGPGGPTPTQTTTTTPTTTTTASTSPTTSSPSPSSTTEEAPPPANSEPPQAPVPPAAPPARPAPPSHRYHLPRLPPTITVPGGPVITIPRGYERP